MILPYPYSCGSPGERSGSHGWWRCLAAVFVATILCGRPTGAQVWTGTSGTVRFHSQSAIEDIDAESQGIRPVLNTADSTLKVTIPVTSFRFRNALMQEHFNTEYMESDRFPFSSFSGKITGAVDYSKKAIYPVTASGIMTIHGVSRPVKAPGTLEVTGHSIRLFSRFTVQMTEFDIRIPALFANTVMDSEDVTITFQSELAPYSK